MLRYRSLQKKERQLARTPRVLANTDRNGKIGVFFSSIINWFSNIKNKFFRKLIEKFTGIDKTVFLPKYNSGTLKNILKNIKVNIFLKIEK